MGRLVGHYTSGGHYGARRAQGESESGLDAMAATAGLGKRPSTGNAGRPFFKTHTHTHTHNNIAV